MKKRTLAGFLAFLMISSVWTDAGYTAYAASTATETEAESTENTESEAVTEEEPASGEMKEQAEPTGTTEKEPGDAAPAEEEELPTTGSAEASLAESAVYGGNVKQENGEKKLVISWRDQSSGKLYMRQAMAAVLKREAAGEKFDVICIEMKDSSDKKLNYELTNEAASILNSKYAGRRIEYSFEDTTQGLKYNWILHKPYTTSIADVDAGVTVKKVSDTQVKLKISGKNFPASRTELQITKESSFGFTEGEVEFYKLTSGVPSDVADVSCALTADRVTVEYAQALQAGVEYLGTTCTEAGTLTVGETLQLETGWTGAITWKSMSESTLSVNAQGVVTALNAGEGYVAAMSGDQTMIFHLYLKKQLQRIVFADEQVTMAAGKTQVLNVLGYPSDVEPEPTELKWEITDASEEGVLSFVEHEGQRNGEVRAEKPGTATVRASWPADAEEATLTAECTVTVEPGFTIPEEHVPDVYVLPQLMTKLSEAQSMDDVFAGGVAEDGTRWKWEWKEPNTKLAEFAGMEKPFFNAIYIENPGMSNEKRLEVALPVRMVTIIGIRLIKTDENGDTPETLEDGQKLYLNYELQVSGTKDGGTAEIDQYLNSEANPTGRLTVTLLSDANRLLDKDENKQIITPYQFTAKASSAGKKTFSICLKDTKTKKVLVKTSESVQVLKKTLADLSEEKIERTEWNGKPCLKISMDAAHYYKLSVKSADSSVVSIGKLTVDRESDPDVVTTYIAYTEKKPGTAWLTITAADEQKTQVRYEMKVTDRQPKAVSTTVTINKAQQDPKGAFSVWFCQGYPLDESRQPEFSQVSVKVNGKTQKADGSEFFVLEKDATENSNESTGFALKLTEAGQAVSNGTYKLKIQLPVTLSEEEKTAGIADSYTIDLTVKVVNTLPTITVKQTKKVNTFYTDAEGNGILTLTTSDGTVPENVVLKDDTRTTCGYELQKNEDGTYTISLKDRSLLNKKKGILTYELPGYINPSTGDSTFTKSYTVSTESVKPTLVLSAKSDVLYPKMDCGESRVRVTDKATGEELTLTKTQFKNASSNSYRMKLNPESGDKSVMQFILGDSSPHYGTDTLQVRLMESNWSDYVTISYRITLKNSTSSAISLGKSVLTLNKEDSMYRAQEVSTRLGLSGCSNILNMGDTETNGHRYRTQVSIVGRDAKSIAAISGNESSLVLKYDSNTGQVIARLHDNQLAAGTYKFYVWVEHKIIGGATTGNYSKKLPLDIKVIDVPSEKCATVSTKGSIDVLRRDTTAITVTPKLVNVYGTITGAELAGTDGWRFALDGNSDTGVFYIRAAAGKTYSTKHAYKVQLKLFVETETGRTYTVTTKEFSVKVTQGRPKLTVTSEGNTLYRQADNALVVTFKALLAKEDIVIENAELLSYRKDMFLSPWYTNETAGEAGQDAIFDVYFEPDQQSVILKNHTTEETLRNGRYTLKFAVTYRDKAGNEKTVTANYSVNVK